MAALPTTFSCLEQLCVIQTHNTTGLVKVIAFMVMVYCPRLFSDHVLDLHMREKYGGNHVERPLPGNAATYEAQGFADAEVELHGITEEKAIKAVFEKWQRHLRFGGWAITLVNKFGEHILFTLPMDKLAEISKKGRTTF